MFSSIEVISSFLCYCVNKAAEFYTLYSPYCVVEYFSKLLLLEILFLIIFSFLIVKRKSDSINNKTDGFTIVAVKLFC